MKVKIFSTQMGEKEIETQATTWGELQADLTNDNIPFNGMRAVIGNTKITLEARGAMLPVEGFTLFLMNKKTKAGREKKLSSYKKKEMRRTIKLLIGQSSDANSYFNKNEMYTSKKKSALLKLLKKWDREEIPSLEVVAKYLAANKNNRKGLIALSKVYKLLIKVNIKDLSEDLDEKLECIITGCSELYFEAKSYQERRLSKILTEGTISKETISEEFRKLEGEFEGTRD
jgi:hypothetical protein